MLEYLNLDLATAQRRIQTRIRELQNRLYELEHAVFDAKIPVMIVFEGWSACGKGRLIQILAERMDPRGFRVVPITPPRTAETRYPWMWRFWLQIPAYGQMVAFDTSWYRRVLLTASAKPSAKMICAAPIRKLPNLKNNSPPMARSSLNSGCTSAKRTEKRFKKLLSDELTAWQVSEADKLQHKKYAKYYQAVEDMLARTDSPHAPWTIVEANDRYYARVKVLETIMHAIESSLPPEALQRSREEMKGAVNA
jgi:AMP-polyphosphate phosphotransferase